MPKKILHLRGSNALLGAERVVLELSRRSLPLGYDSLIVAPQEPQSATPEFIAAARAQGTEALTLRCDGRVDWGFARRLRRLVRDEAIDIVHCHGYKEDFYAAIAGLDVPLVATNHLWKRTTRALRFYCWLDSFILPRFDHVVAVSDPIHAELQAAGLPASRLSKVPNGIDCERYAQSPEETARRAVRRSLGLREGAIVAGMLGSLTREKGHACALAALRGLAGQIPELQLCVVGDGPLRQSLEAQVTAQGLADRVVFAGRRSDVAPLLAAFDIFLLPSLAEGLPMALLEAMASGLPAIASEVGDVALAIEDGVSGRLVPAGAEAPLLAALRELAARPGLRQRLGRAARQRVRTRFSSDAMARAYCRLYDLQLRATPLAALERRA